MTKVHGPLAAYASSVDLGEVHVRTFSCNTITANASLPTNGQHIAIFMILAMLTESPRNHKGLTSINQFQRHRIPSVTVNNHDFILCFIHRHL